MAPNVPHMDDLLARRIDGRAREIGFAGAVRVDDENGMRFAGGFGFADRRFDIPNLATTRMAIASGVKGITALTIMVLAQHDRVRRNTLVRELLGDDLPEIDRRVTVEHLLAHRSGIGDYIDESAGHGIADYVLPIPVHRLDATEDYLPALEQHAQVFPPGERFAYNNSGYVVLALVAERATGTEFHELARRYVLEPAGMSRTAFLRSDRLSADAATGYLEAEGLRTNALHLPIRGSGDGGIYSTVADIRKLWSAMYSGAILPAEVVGEMTRVRSLGAEGDSDYGLGFWIDSDAGAVRLEGYDAGVSFSSCHHPREELTHTVISNWSAGAWPMARHLREALHS